MPSLLSALPCLLITLSIAAGAEPSPPVVRVTAQGLFEGYPAGAKTADGKKAWFEPSAVATDGTTVWFIGDKRPPEKLSSVVRIPLAALNKPVVPFAEVQPVAAVPFAATEKIESTTITENGVRFAATAFERFKPESNEQDQANVLLAWRGTEMEKAAVVNPLTLNGVTASIALRRPLRDALKDERWPQGPPYIKMEGLAALPGNRLWCGIRESGESGDKFAYGATILETKWQEDKEGRITVNPAFRKLAGPPVLNGDAATGPLGVSSLEYDPHHQVVWMTASWENDKEDGAFLFAVPVPAGDEPLRILPVPGADGTPLKFNHKVEGLCVVNDRTLLLVSDEDRRPTVIATADGPKTREPQMGVWTLLEVGP